MKRMKIVLPCFLVLILVLIFNFYLSDYFNQENFSGTDFEHHYKMAKFGRTPSGNGIEQPDINYPVFLSGISFLFAQNKLMYYSFFAIIIFFLTPLALFLILKEKVVILFYYSIGVTWWFDLSGALPQLLVSVWFVLFVLKNDFWFRAFSVLVSGLVHSYAPFLFLGAWAILEAFKFFKSKGLFSLGCAGLLNGKVSIIEKTKIGLIGVGDLLRFFSKTFNVIFFVVAFKNFLDNKRFDLVLIGIGLFLSGIFFQPRIWFTLSLFLLIGLTNFFKENSKYRNHLIFFSIITLAWNVLVWGVDKISLYGVGC